MNLGLGTVLIGMDYGIAGEKMLMRKDVELLLDEALALGVKVIDTAPAYQESELVLGKCLPRNHTFKIVTKTPRHIVDVGDIRESCERSLQRLNRENLFGLLVHSTFDLLSDRADYVYGQLASLKEERLVEKIGLSAYSPQEVDQVLSRYPLDIVQLPLNVLDQRFIESNCLFRLVQKGVEIHTRSAFLQGLLLMDPEKTNEYFVPIRKHLGRYRQFLQGQKLTPVEGALAFVLQQKLISTVIIGVASKNQLNEIIHAAETVQTKQMLNFSSFSWSGEAIINPSRWALSS